MSGLAVVEARTLAELVVLVPAADTAELKPGGRRSGAELAADAEALAVDDARDKSLDDAAAMVLAAAGETPEEGAARDEEGEEDDGAAEGDDGGAEEGAEALPLTPKPVIVSDLL